MRALFLLLPAVLTILAACAPAPQRTGLPSRWEPSPNTDARRPNLVILHHTTNHNPQQALRTLTDPARAVSAHYLIGRGGELWQLVDERARAWHAGDSYWGGATDVNSASIGIELDNNGDEPFPERQIDTLIRLLADLRSRLGIPAANVIGHADVAPRRKVDPSRHFPWRRLAAAGFGLWCEPPFTPAPAGFTPALGLAALGYDVSHVAAASLAFRRHYAASDAGGPMTEDERDILYCLVQRRAAARGEPGAP